MIGRRDRSANAAAERAAQAAGALTMRVDALDGAIALAEGRFPEHLVADATRVATRVRERMRHGTATTVVALAGATGSGKSSLFNALCGVELSAPGVRRPTTGEVHACIWPAPADQPADAQALLDWLDIPRRHALPTGEAGDPLAGLVLLDLPDHDSIEAAHRIEVDRLVELVDTFVWVVDPEKYADAALHDGYLRPLAAHGDVMLFVLNKADRLPAGEADRLAADLRRLLVADGIEAPQVQCTSTRTGEGVVALRAELARRVAAKAAAVTRLEADLLDAAAPLGGGCADVGERGRRSGAVDRAARDRLVDALGAAAGVERVADAVAADHRLRSSAAAGWPLTRWLGRFRANPLRRLHLAPEQTGLRTSLPPAGPAERAALAVAVRDVAGAAAGHLPEPWPSLARRSVAGGDEAALLARLDRAVATTDLATARRPHWWRVANVVQVVLAVVALAGGLWLAGLAVIDYLQLPDPPLPRIGRAPLPTVGLIGGLAAGLLLAWLGRLVARIGATRRRRVARSRLHDAVGTVADDAVLAPIAGELAAHGELCGLLQRVGGQLRG